MSLAVSHALDPSLDGGGDSRQISASASVSVYQILDDKVRMGVLFAWFTSSRSASRRSSNSESVRDDGTATGGVAIAAVIVSASKYGRRGALRAASPFDKSRSWARRRSSQGIWRLPFTTIVSR